MKKMVKSPEMIIQNSPLLQQQIHQVESENQYRRMRKKRTKYFIQNGGSLTVAEIKKQEEEQRRELGELLNLGRLGHVGHRSTVIVGF